MEPFLIKLLKQAISDRDSNVIASPRLEELYPLFIKQWKLARPSPDNVLRVNSEEDTLIPANSPTAVVLRFALTKVPKLQELKRMLRDTPPPTSSI